MNTSSTANSNPRESGLARALRLLAVGIGAVLGSLVLVFLVRWIVGTMAFGAAARHNATVVAQAYADGALPGSRALCTVNAWDVRGNCRLFRGGSLRMTLDCDDDPPAHNDGCVLRYIDDY